MPDRIVVVDGVQHVFPADASDAEISDALNGHPSQGWGSSLRSIASPEGLAALKAYGNELVSGDGTARSQVADYGKKEGSAFLSTLNPVNQVKGVLRLVTTNPIDTAKGIYQTGKSALEGDPAAVGSILGTVVAPKADAGVLRGVNSAATAVAESPKLQGTAGYIGGAGVGIAGGGHPFIMGRIGQAASPVIGGTARAVANATGKVMDTFGMSEKPVPYAQRDIAASPLGPKSLHDLVVEQGFDRYAPNVSPSHPSGSFGPSASDIPIPPRPIDLIDRYAPNVGATSTPAELTSVDIPKPIAQGVYAQLPDGSWGVKALPGHQLVSGEPVNIANSAGQMSVKTVGKIGPDGIASIGADAPMPPAAVVSGRGGEVLPADVQARVMELLKKGQP